MGERWRESGRKRDGEEGKKRARAQAMTYRENENIPQCHTNGGSILVLL